MSLESVEFAVSDNTVVRLDFENRCGIPDGYVNVREMNTEVKVPIQVVGDLSESLSAQVILNGARQALSGTSLKITKVAFGEPAQPLELGSVQPW